MFFFIIYVDLLYLLIDKVTDKQQKQQYTYRNNFQNE